jgi:biopolymer transport protein ExbD
MAFPLPDDGDDEVLSQINTTPLVDVMLVLLIIFLITIPVVAATVPVALPKESNQPRDSDPAIVTIAIDAQGRWYWQDVPLKNMAEIDQRLQAATQRAESMQIQIRADENVDFEYVSKILQQLKSQGVRNIGFVVEPP